MSARVLAIEAFWRSVMSTSTSVRSEVGKNCCSTKRIPNTDSAKTASVTAIVSHFSRIATSSSPARATPAASSRSGATALPNTTGRPLSTDCAFRPASTIALSALAWDMTEVRMKNAFSHSPWSIRLPSLSRMRP